MEVHTCYSRSYEAQAKGWLVTVQPGLAQQDPTSKKKQKVTC
jgi:hypothetical protein